MTEEQTRPLVTALSTFALVITLIGLVILVLAILGFWKIFAKAGYSGALSLFLLIPIVNLVLFLFLAFAKWPILRELEALRARAGGSQPPHPPPQDPQR